MNDCLIHLFDKEHNIIYYGYYIEKEISKIDNTALKEGIEKYNHFDWDKSIITKAKRYDWVESKKKYDKKDSEYRHFKIEDENNILEIYNMKYYFK